MKTAILSIVFCSMSFFIVAQTTQSKILSSTHNGIFSSFVIGDIYVNGNSGFLGSNTFQIFNNTSLTFDVDLNNNYYVFPNPTTHSLTIRSERKIDKVKLLDYLGNTLIECKEQSEIDISMLPAGNYLLFINDNQIVKLIKQ